MDLHVRFEKYVVERELLAPGAVLVLGVSGGPDSLCLLDLFHRLAPDWRLRLHVAHLDHGLRAEAGAEAGFVRAEADKRGLAFHTRTVDTPAYARAHRLSVEEAARELRYAFLAGVAEEQHAGVIAVAHNTDDQVETVLMHFLRGSGLAGLRGMLPKSDLSVSVAVRTDTAPDLGPRTASVKLSLIRPLLDISRAEVEAYCAEHGLRPIRDPSNADRTFFRNRLRRDLLPELERYNPRVRTGLARMAEVVAGEYEMLQRLTAALWEANARLEAGRVVLDRPRWLALSLAEQRALLRESVRRLRPQARNIDFTPLEAAIRFSRRAGPGRSCDVLAGLRLSISTGHISLEAGPAAPPEPADLPLLDEQGQLGAGWHFVMENLGREGWSLAQVEANADPWHAYVDAGRLPGPVTLRARRPGDRMRPMGMDGRAKVSDLMINLKVAAPWRDRWPLVVSGGDIIWLAGLRLDERYKVTPQTQQALCLRFARQADDRAVAG